MYRLVKRTTSNVIAKCSAESQRGAPSPTGGMAAKYSSAHRHVEHHADHQGHHDPAGAEKRVLFRLCKANRMPPANPRKARDGLRLALPIPEPAQGKKG